MREKVRQEKLIFLVTEQCNFRCTYCYENFEKGKMSDDVIEGVIKYVEKRGPQLKNLNVHWFGGEPLLALDVIEKLSNQMLDTKFYTSSSFSIW
jgi:uncharacterized protein